MISMMIYHFIIALSCSSMVVLGVELSCNKSSTTCPGDVVQCRCLTSGVLEWSASDQDVVIAAYTIFSVTGDTTYSVSYTTVLCSVDESTSPVTLTSKLTVTLTNTVDVTCRGGDDGNTTRLTVAGKLSTIATYAVYT